MLLAELVVGYVGPGPALGFFWAFLALLGTIALSILYLLIWPVRALIRKIRGTDATAQNAPDAQRNDATNPPPSSNS